MPFTPSPLLAAYLKGFARSVLLSLGLDYVLIDFLESAAVGAASVFIVLLFVAIHIPHRRSAKSAHLNPAIRNTDQKIQETLIKTQHGIH
jgi:hypothetical protein